MILDTLAAVETRLFGLGDDHLEIPVLEGEWA
jgi:hypothetical protein